MLTPKNTEDAPFLQARLGFGPTGLSRMEFSDALGQRTVIALHRLEAQPGLWQGAFRFTPPKGVDVVGEVNQAAQVTPLRD